MSKGLLDRLRLAVEWVTGVTIDADGVFKAEGADDHELDGSVGWQFGFYSRAKGSVNGVVLKADGQGNTSLLIAYRDKQYELSLEEGEVGIKNAFNTSILLDKNNRITMSASEIDAGGDAYSALKTEDFLAYFNTFLGQLATDLAAGGGSTTSTTPISPATYKSMVLKHG